jgi:glycerophosphoryl diester phosphodiesterase
MVAFQGVYDLGFRHIETDLHLTSDGVLVCFHDPEVDRTTNGAGEVSALTLGELQELDAGYRHADSGSYPFRSQGIYVPTFEELLSAFPDVGLVVDMKASGLAEPLAELVERLGVGDRLIVGSFSDQRLEVFRDLTNGRVPTSTGPVAARMWVLNSRVGRGGGGRADALQVPTQLRGVRVVDGRLVRAAHEAELQVHVWTVNDPDEMNRLLDLGVDGLITDRPNVLRDVLISRDEWRNS